jgi:hypothetical protein
MPYGRFIYGKIEYSTVFEETYEVTFQYEMFWAKMHSFSPSLVGNVMKQTGRPGGASLMALLEPEEAVAQS